MVEIKSIYRGRGSMRRREVQRGRPRSESEGPEEEGREERERAGK